MKKTLLAALATLTAQFAAAQPTLTAASNNPIIGNMFIGHHADTAHVGAGPAVAAAMWDFTALTETDRDTTVYLSCAATTYCDSFSGANIVAFRDSSYEYGIASSSGHRITGMYEGDMLMRFTNAQEPLVYPVTYHTTYKDTVVMSIPGMGTPVNVSRVDSSVADSYGTLKLPTGTYTSVLRIHTTSLQVVSIVLPTGTYTDSTQQEHYSWYAAGFRSPLLQMNYDTAGGIRYLTDVSWYSKPAALQVSEHAATRANLLAYPNPATGNIHLQFTAAEALTAQVTIKELAGRQVMQFEEQASTGINDLYIPLPDLPSGMYVVILNTGTNILTEKIMVAN